MNNSCSLSDRECVPCKGGVPPLSEEQSGKFLSELEPDWNLVDNHHIERTYKFPNFAEARAFTNRVGDVAEQQGHHPDIELGWGRAKITLCTHKINGLTESDFILAAKADAAL